MKISMLLEMYVLDVCRLNEHFKHPSTSHVCNHICHKSTLCAYFFYLHPTFTKTSKILNEFNAKENSYCEITHQTLLFVDKTLRLHETYKYMVLKKLCGQPPALLYSICTTLMYKYTLIIRQKGGMGRRRKNVK